MAAFILYLVFKEQNTSTFILFLKQKNTAYFSVTGHGPQYLEITQ